MTGPGDEGADPGAGADALAATGRAAGDAAEAWEPVPGVGEPLENLELDDLDRLAELTHPIRGLVLRRLKQPRTVAELAVQLDVPVTRLYHHVNRLQAAELIHVVATRRVAAVTERRYQVVARSFRLGHQLFEELDGREIGVALGSLFDLAKLDLQHSLEDRRPGDPLLDEHLATMSLGELHLSPARHRELIARLDELVAEYVSDLDDDDPDGARVTLMVAAFPTDR